MVLSDVDSIENTGTSDSSQCSRFLGSLSLCGFMRLVKFSLYVRFGVLCIYFLFLPTTTMCWCVASARTAGPLLLADLRLFFWWWWWVAKSGTAFLNRIRHPGTWLLPLNCFFHFKIVYAYLAFDYIFLLNNYDSSTLSSLWHWWWACKEGSVCVTLWAILNQTILNTVEDLSCWLLPRGIYVAGGFR